MRPLVRRTCDATVAIPLAGKVGSLNVSVAAAVLLFEARRQRTARRWLSRPSTCSTATTCSTRGRSRIATSSWTRSRATWRGEGRAASSSSTAWGRSVRSARCRSGSHRTRTICSNGSPRTTAGPSASASSRPTTPCAGRPGRRCGSSLRVRSSPSSRPSSTSSASRRGAGGRVGDRLDAETRERLERLRRGELDAKAPRPHEDDRGACLDAS